MWQSAFLELTEKTTTTSMISQILIDAKKDPTVLVGGMLSTINGNIRLGTFRKLHH